MHWDLGEYCAEDELKDIASPMVLAISLGCVNFWPFFSICFTDRPLLLPLILWTMSQHIFINVLAFNFDTFAPTILLVGTNDLPCFSRFIHYSCKFAFVGDLLKTLKTSFSI